MTGGNGWAPELYVPAGTDAVTVPIFRRSGFRLRYLLPAGSSSPPSPFRVTLAAAAPETATGVTWTVSCPQPQREPCAGPAGRWHFKVAAGDLAAVFRWDVSLPAGGEQTVDLGAFREGTSISGWVTASDGNPVATVSCEPASFGSIGGAPDRANKRQRWRLYAEEGTSDGRGAFAFHNLPAGTYSLQAHRGRSQSKRADAIVGDGESHRLAAPLHLLLPLDVRLQLLPDVAPDGEPWRVRLWKVRTEASAVELKRDALAQAGIWEWPVTAGRYRATVSSQDGSTWHAEEWDVHESWDGSWRLITIGLVPVAGRLFLGDSPSTGEIFFGGAKSEPSIRLRADAEGYFQGNLPRAGAWPLEVELGTGSLQEVSPVEVEAPGADAPIPFVEIHVHDNSIAGTVRREGQPTEAQLFALRRDPRSGQMRRVVEYHVPSTGEFELHGLTPGDLELQATSREGVSPPVARPPGGAGARRGRATGHRLGHRACGPGDLRGPATRGGRADRRLSRSRAPQPAAGGPGGLVQAARPGHRLGRRAHGDAPGVRVGPVHGAAPTRRRAGRRCLAERVRQLVVGGAPLGDGTLTYNGTAVPLTTLLPLLIQRGLLGDTEDGRWKLGGLAPGQWSWCTASGCAAANVIDGMEVRVGEKSSSPG